MRQRSATRCLPRYFKGVVPNHAVLESLRTWKMESLGFLCGWIVSFMDRLHQVNRITRIALQVDGQAASPVARRKGAGVWVGRGVPRLRLS